MLPPCLSPSSTSFGARIVFLFFQIIALAYLRNKQKERHIEEMEARIRKLEAEKGEKEKERERVAQ